MTTMTKHLFAVVLLVAGTIALVGASEVTEWDLVYQARVAAENDDHRKSISLYLAAIAKRPLVLSEVAIELAHQYTWAEMPDSAIYWYEYTLLGDPDNLDAKLGIARALAWGDRLHESEAYYDSLLAESGGRRNDVLVGWAKTKSWRRDYVSAERTYRQVLAEDPEHHEARLGLAEVTLWSGRPRRAQLMYEELLADDPGDAEAMKGLAAAQEAAGRPDVALETLSSAQTDEDFSPERESFDRRGSIDNSNTLLYRDNTTDGEYRALVILVGVDVANRTRVGVEYTNGRMTQEGRPDIRRHQIAVPMSQRFSEALAINLAPGYQWNGFAPVSIPPATATVDDFNLFVWDAYATVFPADWVRFDIGNSRETLTIPQTVFRQIHLTTNNIGLDWRMSPRVMLFLEPSYRTYSDDNARVAVGQRLEWSPPWLHLPIKDYNVVTLFQTLEYLSFQKQLSHGYFDPSDYVQLTGGARLVTDIGKRVRFMVSGALGSEKQEALDWATTGAFETELQFKIGGNGYLKAGYVHSGSRLRAADGFRAKGFYITLDFYIPR
jgi:tetratricopeptide (TPR) repeat protein